MKNRPSLRDICPFTNKGVKFGHFSINSDGKRIFGVQKTEKKLEAADRDYRQTDSDEVLWLDLLQLDNSLAQSVVIFEKKSKWVFVII